MTTVFYHLTSMLMLLEPVLPLNWCDMVSQNDANINFKYILYRWIPTVEVIRHQLVQVVPDPRYFNIYLKDWPENDSQSFCLMSPWNSHNGLEWKVTSVVGIVIKIGTHKLWYCWSPLSCSSSSCIGSKKNVMIKYTINQWHSHQPLPYFVCRANYEMLA